VQQRLALGRSIEVTGRRGEYQLETDATALSKLAE
jgi:hypothetical protein